MKSNRSIFLKFFEVFFMFLVVIGLTQYFDFASQLQAKVIKSGMLFSAVFGTIILLSGLLAYIWHKFIKKTDLHPWFQTIITFYVAHMISTYGAAKILKTQFQVPNYILESPINEVSGFWLTWTYFGYSSTMAYILGGMQILGCLLLIFRKTRLMATFILLPIMVNIDLIDHFFRISSLAYYNSLHYTFMLIFIMMLDFDKLKDAFLSYKEYYYFNRKTVIFNLIRIVVIGGAFLHIYLLREGQQPKTALDGVWKIEEITQQKQNIIPSYTTMDSVWSKVYLEGDFGIVFKYNPDKFDDSTDMYGQYKVDQSKKEIKVDLYKEVPNQGKNLLLKYQVKDSSLVMRGMYKKDSLIMRLKKLK